MTDYNKLLDALHTIQDECISQNSCEDCPFYAEKNNRDTSCGLRQINPAFWRIKRNCVIRLLEDD